MFKCASIIHNRHGERIRGGEVCNPRTLLFSISKGHSPNPWSLELPEAEHLRTDHSVATGVTRPSHIAARILPWHLTIPVSQTEL